MPVKLDFLQNARTIWRIWDLPRPMLADVFEKVAQLLREYPEGEIVAFYDDKSGTVNYELVITKEERIPL